MGKGTEGGSLNLKPTDFVRQEGLTAKEAVKRGVMMGVKRGGCRWGVKVA